MKSPDRLRERAGTDPAKVMTEGLACSPVSEAPLSKVPWSCYGYLASSIFP